MKKFISLLTTSLVFLFASSTASAMLIDGTISLFGTSTTTANMDGDKAASVVFNTAYVGSITGDFITEGVIALDSSVPTFGSPVTILDLDPISPLASLWTIMGFSFDLDTITKNEIVGGAVTIAGTGYVKHIDYDNTLSSWLFTSQIGGETTFSSISVPAPAGLALLGLALLGFGFTRRNYLPTKIKA